MGKMGKVVYGPCEQESEEKRKIWIFNMQNRTFVKKEIANARLHVQRYFLKTRFSRFMLYRHNGTVLVQYWYILKPDFLG